MGNSQYRVVGYDKGHLATLDSFLKTTLSTVKRFEGGASKRKRFIESREHLYLLFNVNGETKGGLEGFLDITYETKTSRIVTDIGVALNNKGGFLALLKEVFFKTSKKEYKLTHIPLWFEPNNLRSLPLEKLLKENGFNRSHKYIRMALPLNDDDDLSKYSLNTPTYLSISGTTSSDIASITKLQNDSFMSHFGYEPNSVENMKNQLQEKINQRCSLVAKDKTGTLVGFIYTSVPNNSVAWVAWIEMVGVSKAYRGKGVGKVLVKKAVENLRTKGTKKVCLEVDEVNKGAVSLYRGFGFNEYQSYNWWEKRASNEA